MRILAIGDIVGSIGCRFLRDRLPALKKVKGVDMVIANGENSADGNGLTPASIDYIFQSGVDVMTAGNHTFRRRESYPVFDTEPYLLRPANYPNSTTPGRGSVVFDMGRTRVKVINLLGCMFMDFVGDPFEIIDELVCDDPAPVTVLDFHAEATSEKLAMGYYLDGRVSAVFGTHTHVQTADEMILPNGTGYITDVGMTGPVNSILGVKPEIVIKKFREKMPVRFDLSGGECKMDCVIFDINEKTGKTESVERMEIK